MTWFAQVRHVMMKDARESRWLLGTYIAVAAVATTHALGWFDVSQVLEVSMFVLVLFGMIVSASLVQSDSPTKSNVFWTSRPFDPSAVLCAKIALVGIVVFAIPVFGQWAALASYGVRGSALASMLTTSALAFSLWLLIALIVGAMTRDLRTFVVALVVTPVALIFFAGLIFGSESGVSPNWIKEALVVVAVGGGAAFLYLLYRRRDSWRRMLAASVLLVACSLAALSAPSPSDAATEMELTPGKERFAAEVMNMPDLTKRGEMQLRVRIDGAPRGQSITLLDPTVTIAWAKDSVARLPMHNSFSLSTASLPAQSTISGSDALHPMRNDVSFGVPIPDSLRAAVAGGLRRVWIDGRLFVRTPQFVAAAPLRAGASLATNNRRIAVTKWSHGFGDVLVEAKTVSLGDGSSPPGRLASIASTEYRLAVASASHDRVIPLEQRSSQSGSLFLVLPGVSFNSGIASFHAARRDSVPSDTWFENAQLLLIDWKTVGSYRVHVEAARDTTPARARFLPSGRESVPYVRTPKLH